MGLALPNLDRIGFKTVSGFVLLRDGEKLTPQKANYYGYNLSGIVYPRTGTSDLGLEGHFISPVDIYKPITDSEVAVPSDMMAIGDSFYGGAEFPRGKLGKGTPADNMLTYGNTLIRHQGRANVVFCDGHVESPTLQFLFEDTSDAALVRWNRDHQPHREKLSP
jgi:prepilin-type processing-associated H-X9-DG protein